MKKVEYLLLFEDIYGSLGRKGVNWAASVITNHRFVALLCYSKPTQCWFLFSHFSHQVVSLIVV